jgi:hypothetical protein
MAAAARRSPPRAERGTDVSSRSGRTRYYSDRKGRALTHEDSSERVHKFRQQGQNVGYQSPGGNSIGGTVTKPGLPSKTYHRIVLAEFAACIVIVGVSPVLTPRTTVKGGKTVADTTVSYAGPLVRLTAVCIVFFVLALMASGERTGKIAAAFGGLVLAGALLNATDMFAALGKAFGPGKGSFSGNIGATTGQTIANAFGPPPGAGEAAGDAAAGAFGGISPTPSGNPIPPPLGATG